MQIKQKLSKQIMSLSNGYINKGMNRGTTLLPSPEERFQRPTCKPQACNVLEILSGQSIYGQGFLPHPSSWTFWCYPFTPFQCWLGSADVQVPKGGVLCRCGLQGYKGEHNSLGVKHSNHKNMAQFLLYIFTVAICLLFLFSCFFLLTIVCDPLN